MASSVSLKSFKLSGVAGEKKAELLAREHCWLSTNGLLFVFSLRCNDYRLTMVFSNGI